MRSLVGLFFLRSLAFLAPALALWYWLKDYVILLPAWISAQILEMSFPFWVKGTELHDTTLSLLTSISVKQNGRVADLVFEADVLAYCYGLPLLVAFLCASRARHLGWKILAGAFILVPLQVWGTCFHLLMQVTAYGGSSALWRTGFSEFHLNAFGLCYQIGYLLLPTLGPVLIWLWFERKFMIAVMLEATLGEVKQDAELPPPAA